MNQLATLSNHQTMSSLEIAELTGKEHKEVLRDIRKTMESLKIDSAQFCSQYTDATGRKLPMFKLPKRESLILVSGYRIDVRARIIDRWQALEDQQPKALPSNYKEALLELIRKEEEKEALALALEDKTIELDQAKEWISIKRVAKINGISQKDISWRILKNMGEGMGYAPIKAFDANYGMVNTYHRSVWVAAYPSLQLDEVI